MVESCGCKRTDTHWTFLCEKCQKEVKEISARWNKERIEMQNFVPIISRLNGKLILDNTIKVEKPVEDPVDIIGATV